MIIQDIQASKSTKDRNIKENKQSRDSFVTFTAARIDGSYVEIEELGTSSWTRSESKEEKIHQPLQILASIQKSVSDLIPTLEKLEAKYIDIYL
ncbi:16846_t:CDS:2 [Acaulospora colombiana]|uniref:16846_t:CDS:1 n=1 Tax=Acaulospora colombiana TaxID=27376 RepID=A0ACA9L659_9GLOM|nr:16846_t:CDS:2 [Acaulospora colombiana]